MVASWSHGATTVASQSLRGATGNSSNNDKLPSLTGRTSKHSPFSNVHYIFLCLVHLTIQNTLDEQFIFRIVSVV